MLKKVYSVREQRHVWMFDVTVGGQRIRQGGFVTKREAAEVLDALRAEHRSARASRSAQEIASQHILESGVNQLIDSRLAPVLAENERLRNEAEGGQLISVDDASHITGLPRKKIRDAIIANELPAYKQGQRFRVRRADARRYAEQVFAAARTAPALADDASPDELRKALQASRPRIIAAQRYAKSVRRPNWREAVSEGFPELSRKVIEMLPTSKASDINYEHIGESKLGVSGRQLRRRLSKKT